MLVQNYKEIPIYNFQLVTYNFYPFFLCYTNVRVNYVNINGK